MDVGLEIGACGLDSLEPGFSFEGFDWLGRFFFNVLSV